MCVPPPPPQVYAANRGSATAKGRWLARGVDLLLHQYPGLRVAFLDSRLGPTGTQQHSVLIRARIGVPASDPGCTEELYRVRLPQNRETGHGVVLGEGKPENQNAAIIFCFGEVVQVRGGPAALPLAYLLVPSPTHSNPRPRRHPPCSPST